MIALAAAAAAWITVHIGIAGSPLRDRTVRVLGEAGFRMAFSIVSVVVIGALVYTWRRAPVVPLWQVPPATGWALALLMLLAAVLFVASTTARNPGAIGGETMAPATPTGVLRVTRHPMLWSFALWAAVHVIANGDVASLLFFGAFLLTALAGMRSIDGKVARRNPAAWAALARTTSILPGMAIAGGRNRFVAREWGWPAALGGVALFALLVWLHPRVIGVAPWPG